MNDKYVIGVDLGKGDSTAVSVIDNNVGGVIIDITATHESWEILFQLIKDICEGMDTTKVVIANNGIGSWVAESLQEMGLTVYTFLKTKRKR